MERSNTGADAKRLVDDSRIDTPAQIEFAGQLSQMLADQEVDVEYQGFVLGVSILQAEQFS